MGLGPRALATGAFGSMAFGSMLELLAEGTRMHRFYFLAVVVAKGFAGSTPAPYHEARLPRG
jgi:hypothetical protein